MEAAKRSSAAAKADIAHTTAAKSSNKINTSTKGRAAACYGTGSFGCVCTESTVLTAGLEPAISALGGQRRIHWATRAPKRWARCKSHGHHSLHFSCRCHVFPSPCLRSAVRLSSAVVGEGGTWPLPFRLSLSDSRPAYPRSLGHAQTHARARGWFCVGVSVWISVYDDVFACVFCPFRVFVVLCRCA